MAEITTLEEKLAEVTGLARAAQDATKKIEGMVEDEQLTEVLQRMRHEAEETDERCSELIDGREGKKTAILDKAQETKSEAAEMMSTYLGEDSDALDGFEFLTMAEAAEVGHWAVLGKLNEKAGEGEIAELVAWALPIQERHFNDVKEGSLKLAGEEDPNSRLGVRFPPMGKAAATGHTCTCWWRLFPTLTFPRGPAGYPRSA